MIRAAPGQFKRSAAVRNLRTVMPNGRQGDHPITDMLYYGEHPFPSDIEEMLRKLHAIDPMLILGADLSREPFDWEKGRSLEAGRKRLKELLARHDTLMD